jgi:Domain of unknown function (DUF4328)
MTINKVSRPFSSTRAVSELLIILLAAHAAISLVDIAVSFYEVMALSDMLRDAVDPGSRAEIQRIIGAIQFVVSLFAWGFSLFWFYRVHRNLPALGVLRGKYNSPWNILLFFVPIVNLYFGYHLVKELWKQSNPDVGFSDDFLRKHASPLKEYSSKTALIGIWWGFTLASASAARVTSQAALHSTSVSDYIRDAEWFMISDALATVASIMLIVVVTRIEERQEEKHRRLTLREAEAERDRSIPVLGWSPVPGK